MYVALLLGGGQSVPLDPHLVKKYNNSNYVPPLLQFNTIKAESVSNLCALESERI